MFEYLIASLVNSIGDNFPDLLGGMSSDWIVGPDECGLSIDKLGESVERVAGDMGLPVPEVYVAPDSFGEHLTNDPATLLDDQIGADPRIVDAINDRYADPHAYDVITAHELGHAKIGASGLRDSLTPRAEEVFCDTQAGLYAGTKGLSPEIFHGEVGPAGSDADHPAGVERCRFFDKAYNLAHNYVFKDFQPITRDPTQADKVVSLFNEVLSAYNNPSPDNH